ncbi:aspartate dehydrogenase [Candidatus Nitrososphaera evergladensis SR1]|jgi:aspartate dehydrogenase|uniref:L-aspartate dehydrogenase n=1 Tax=Candidatus Nitrososphaera evergladensis SR1 TaxID=1459636 RepID=A0A075MWW1_9ARCH|nr:aspartate dehydrogenase [Candidatus Nitrososphaera evergladensis]AIF83759.1 aspartate dehydrogenase [Candidatus Nitrososphaera evergladensis SR1]
MPARKVGIIGCGTIGSQLAIAVDTGAVRNASLVSLFDVVQNSAQVLKQKLNTGPSAYSSFDDFIKKTDCDIVVEAASQEAVKRFAVQVLRAEKDLMVMSVGALADKTFLSELLREAEKAGRRLYVPTGAIAGIDAIRAVKHLLDSVTLATTKSPKALAGAPFFETSKVKLDEIKERTVIYEGTAADAVRAFPANVNVAAVLSLAGIGVDRTKVRIIADPAFTTNQHEITAKGSFGEFRFTVNNVPSPGNPKTSYLAVLSAIECLRSICDDGMRVGS